MTIGGHLYNGAPEVWKAVDGEVTVGGTADQGRWNFNGGLELGIPLSASFVWSEFELLARTATSSELGDGYKVVVVEHGGEFDLFDFRGPDAQAYDRGHTLVVFNTDEDVILKRTENGRQFGPSVLAPFSKVVLLDSAGFIDGFLVALEFESRRVGTNAAHLQMHGHGYAGPLPCPPATTR